MRDPIFNVGDLFCVLEPNYVIPVWKHSYRRHWRDSSGFIYAGRVGIVVEVWRWKNHNDDKIAWKYKVLIDDKYGWIDECDTMSRLS